jgi:hypothetical protein
MFWHIGVFLTIESGLGSFEPLHYRALCNFGQIDAPNDGFAPLSESCIGWPYSSMLGSKGFEQKNVWQEYL